MRRSSKRLVALLLAAEGVVVVVGGAVVVVGGTVVVVGGTVVVVVGGSSSTMSAKMSESFARGVLLENVKEECEKGGNGKGKRKKRRRKEKGERRKREKEKEKDNKKIIFFQKERELFFLFRFGRTNWDFKEIGHFEKIVENPKKNESKKKKKKETFFSFFCGKTTYSLFKENLFFP